MDLFESIIENSNDAIISKDLDGIVQTWNPAAENIFGYKGAEIIGQHISLIIPPDKLFEEPAFIAAMRLDRQIEHFQTERIRKDGRRIQVSISLSPVKNTAGEIIGIAKIARDITEQKKAAEAIARSEERLRSTLDQLLEGVQIISPDWRYLYLNDAAVSQGKYRKEELIGHTMMEKYPGIEKTDLFQDMLKCLATGEATHLDNAFYFPDGSTGWFELYIQKVPEGLFILSIDITRRKEIENQLRLSENTYRTIASSIPGSVICLLDPDYRYYLIEGDLLDRLGYRKENLISKTIQEALSTEAYHDLLPFMKRVFNGESFVVENMRNGFDTISKFVPLIDSSGRIYAAMIVVFDISELKKAQRRVDEQFSEMKRLSTHLKNVREDERKHIAREIHDELGQLASAVKMELDWLKIHDTWGDEKFSKHLSHAVNIISMVIDTTRSVAASLRPRIIDEMRLTESLRWQCDEFERRSGINCEVNLEFNDEGLSEELHVELYRICQESLTNVMRHAAARQVWVSLHGSHNRLELCVTDNGKGFDIQQKTTHLGLVGIRERALSIGGQLHIVSEPGKGTKLCVTIGGQSLQ
jgi:PAS domain S-box-containing protein